MHQALLKAFEVFGFAPHSQSENEIPHNARCRCSPLLPKRPAVLFVRLLNATSMLLQSTPLSVGWSMMDVSLRRRDALAPPRQRKPSRNLGNCAKSHDHGDPPPQKSLPSG